MYTHVYIHIYVHKLAVSSPSCQHLRSLSRGATCRLRYMRAWRSLNLKSPSSSHVSTSVASDKLVQCKSTVTYIHTDICVHKIFICIDVYISIRNCFFIFPHLPASTHSGLRILERHFPWTPIRSSLELTNVEFVSSSEGSTSIASDKPFAWYIYIIIIHVCIYVHTHTYICEYTNLLYPHRPASICVASQGLELPLDSDTFELDALESQIAFFLQCKHIGCVGQTCSM